MDDKNKAQEVPPPYPTQPGMAPYPAQPNAGMPPYPPQPGPAVYGAPAPYPPQSNQGFNFGQPAPIIAGAYDSDAEGMRPEDAGMGGSFGEKAVRRSFIRKVYGILCCQLLLTGAIITVFTFHEPLRAFAKQSTWLYWVAFAITFVCLIAMACCEGVRRKFPTNLIFLGIFTGAEGFMLGTLCAHFEADAILIAVGITVGVTLGLTLFAFQTKIDFTNCGGMLCALLVVLMIAGIILSFTGMGKIAQIGYGSAGALIFSLYIVYDTQLMMGGSHKYSLSPEEYVFAALNIYLDVINLFMYILMIVGAVGGDD